MSSAAKYWTNLKTNIWGMASLLFIVISCCTLAYVLRPAKPVSYEIRHRKPLRKIQDSLYKFKNDKVKFYYQQVPFDAPAYRTGQESNLME